MSKDGFFADHDDDNNNSPLNLLSAASDVFRNISAKSDVWILFQYYNIYAILGQI